jgi:hypothetical protein
MDTREPAMPDECASKQDIAALREVLETKFATTDWITENFSTKAELKSVREMLELRITSEIRGLEVRLIKWYLASIFIVATIAFGAGRFIH